MRLGQVAVVEVSLEGVVGRDAEVGLDDGLDGGDGLQVLQVGAQALELEGGPDEDLGHAGAVVGELGEHVGGGLVLGAGLLDGITAVPEDDLRMMS